MKRELLPIGSVVLLKGGEKRVMICGRIQTKAGEDIIYDYSACYFPEGIIDPRRMFFSTMTRLREYFLSDFRTRKSCLIRKC